MCVYHRLWSTAVRALGGSGIPVAAVSTGFPAGLSPLKESISEIKNSVEAGAQEIDVVITRGHVFGGEWQKLYDEIVAFKDACGPAHSESDPGNRRFIDAAERGKGESGSDDGRSRFHQDFHGERDCECNAADRTGDVRAIREYAEETEMAVGFKPAGGIRTAKQSLEWLTMMKEELGDAWLLPHLFRFGASGMLADIERQLEFHVTGRYSAEHRHPLA